MFDLFVQSGPFSDRIRPWTLHPTGIYAYGFVT